MNTLQPAVPSQITAYLDHIKADYTKWFDRRGQRDTIANQMIAEFNDGLYIDRGQKFIKVVSDNGTQRSVHSFIVMEDGGKFKAGDILKAASWNAPAKNFARGNVFVGDFSKISWTGAN